jgi:hypothetical protein
MRILDEESFLTIRIIYSNLSIIMPFMATKSNGVILEALSVNSLWYKTRRKQLYFRLMFSKDQ